MYRSKDFLLMEVLNTKGKKIGFINDILIDFSKGYIEGFSVCCSNLLNKNMSILKEDIISFNENIIVAKSVKEEKLRFFKLKGMEVIDRHGNDMGVMEDIIFDDYSFKIYGLIISRGLINNFIKGKKIFLIKQLLLGDKDILYYGDETKIKFKTMPHNITGVNK
ncbi:PRC-barrel domain-containing protein [Clostridium brassicae]|uniref:PRC-barrel domain-containing protein n=1 Tax=Clostridium brassicae TaxID=2999072 RepID=A0ABT4DAT9_9CLOT|nr:PRC-barrel domain-containing protein [Clostridium brassicae]MCY6959426.1 PRC-barrel domain-containing protein [Clostridium brassicae]